MSEDELSILWNFSGDKSGGRAEQAKVSIKHEPQRLPPLFIPKQKKKRKIIILKSDAHYTFSSS